MSRQSQAPESKSEESQPKVKPTVVQELTDDLAYPARLPEGPGAAVGGSAIEAQAARLGDQCFQTGQRQALATRIGRVQGNQHLQRVFVSLKSDERMAYSTLAYQQMPGNQGLQLIQRDNGEESAGGVAAEGVEVPSVTGGGLVGLVGDIISVLDTAVTVVDFMGPVGGAIGTVAGVMEAGAALSFVPFLTAPLAAIAFIVGGLVTLGEANSAGEKWAAVQGASYAIVSIANKRQPPPAASWMGSGSFFNGAAMSQKQRIEQELNRGGEARDRMMAALVSIRRQAPVGALNNIYQRLVREHLQASFLGMEIGGALYSNARRYWLTWPQVGMVPRG